MNYRMILHIISLVMGVEAVFMLPALAICLYLGEAAAVHGFLGAIGLLFLFFLAGVLFRPKKRSIQAREGLLTVGLAWIVVSVFGALPFYLGGSIPRFIDALFETVSGFTTTGASILPDVEILPRGILYWRSFTHWLGGMGVLVFLLSILSFAKGAGHSMHLLRAESPGPKVDKLVPKMKNSAMILYGIYIGLTLLQIALMLSGGASLFDSVTLTFGTAGTGGFAIKNDSLAGYSPYIQIVVAVFMALFGINFQVYYLLLIREFSKALHNEELRAYIVIMLGSALLIFFNILPVYDGHWAKALLDSAFQASSVMTTTGYATTDFNKWPELSRSILVVLMIIGASAGSTGGGVKVSRILIMLKSAFRDIHKMLRSRSVKVLKLDGDVLDEETITSAHVFMAVYFFIAVITFLVISLDNLSMETNLTAMLACLNNIGPGLGAVGPVGNYSSYSDLSTLMLTISMLLGRLELFPLIILLSPSVWKRSLPRLKQ